MIMISSEQEQTVQRSEAIDKKETDKGKYEIKRLLNTEKDFFVT